MEPRAGVKIGVGLFVFAGLLLFATSIFFLGERGRYFATQYALRVYVGNVAGLREGATVRLAGVAVGRVTRIRLPAPPEQRVLVELSVAGDAIDSIRGDSVARVDTMGFMGDKFVEISLGSPEAPRLADGATLRVEEASDFAALVTKAQRVLGQTERLAASLEGGEGAVPWLIHDPESKRLIADTLRSVRTASAAVERGEGAVPWLVHDPESKRLIADTLRSVRTASAAVERGEGAVPWLVHDPESKRLIADTLRSAQSVTASLKRGEGALPWLIQDPASRRFVQDLSRTAETLAALSTEVKEGRGLAHALIYDPEGAKLLAKTSQTVEEVHSLLRAIREGDGALPALLFDPDSRELVENLTRASRRLEEISARIARGEGTLGAFLVDPTLYEDLTAVLEGAERSKILRWGIRHTLQSGRQARKEPAKGQAAEK